MTRTEPDRHDDRRRGRPVTPVLCGLALAHALLTWPLATVVALFGGGVLVAAPLEAIGVQAGLLEHRLRPQVAGVPLAVVAAWPTVVYVPYRVTLLVAPSPVAAALLAAAVATLWDAAVDPVAVRRGLWTYPASPVSRPRFRGVPWWNFVAWPCVVFATAMLPALVP